jgi:hypothetical protein
MKQIIFSAAISFTAIMGNAQTNSSGKAAIWALNDVPLANAVIQQVQMDPVLSPDSITIRVFKDTDGEVVKTFRYYTVVDLLPVHIRSRFAEKFPDYVPTAIIEQHEATGINYIINLSKGNRWLQVHSSSNGRTKVIHRYTTAL